MPKICYVDKNFKPSTLRVIDQANDIISAYRAQGYDLTLRQLYYQFVSRDLIPNRQSEYSRLGSIINDARLAGLIDWDSITDRTRNIRDLSHWADPPQIVDAVAKQYRIDKWATQPYRIEVWIEKDALAGVFERVCQSLDVPYFSCRGYTSQSEMWAAAQRLITHTGKDQQPFILHFGDHDPSGLDMTRDITDRLALFGVDLQLQRMALNMEQVRQYHPPPNPAKETDSRFAGYIAQFGESSWELDALEPTVLSALVQQQVTSLLDKAAWKVATKREEAEKALLQAVSDRWDDVSELVR